MTGPMDGAIIAPSTLARVDLAIRELKTARRDILAAHLIAQIDSETVETLLHLAELGHQGDIGATLRELIDLANQSAREVR